MEILVGFRVGRLLLAGVGVGDGLCNIFAGGGRVMR